MTVLVTGGAGYVGSHAAAALIEAGHEVVVLDDLSTGHRAAIPDGADLIEGDLADTGIVDSVLSERRPRAVLHFAARSIVADSMRDPLGYFEANVVGAMPLFRGAVRHGVDKIVLSSTASLYGEPERIPIDEDTPVGPTNPYGDTKRALEGILRWMGEAHGTRWATLRYFNAAGASLDGRRGEDHRPETHLVPIVLSVALGKRPRIEIRGTDYDTPDGTCIRDYVHVEDLARAHVAALDALASRPSLRLNLGTGRGASVREVVETAREVTGRPIEAVETTRRPGDPPVLVADPSRARRELGWVPGHSDLRTVLETAWRWHCSHPDGYR